MDNSGAKYYYSLLNQKGKQVYHQICDAILNFQSSLTLKSISTAAIHQIFHAVLYDHPAFFYVNRKNVVIAQGIMGITMFFRYDYSKKDAEILWNKMQIRINDCLSQIKPNMKTLAKQIAVHRWMQTNIQIARKPYDKTCFSITGALIHGRCVCEGFAHTYKLICDRLHIASIIVTGSAQNPDGDMELHAWNITRINGITAHIDVTWDTVYGEGSYDYFNLTDAEISVDHTFDQSIYPACTSDAYSYFTVNQLIAKDEIELRHLIGLYKQKQTFAIRLEFCCDPSIFSRIGFPNGRIRFNKARNIISFIRT